MRMQECAKTARNVARLLEYVDERFLGDAVLGETSRADFEAELAAVQGRNADLVATFPAGVAFHHAGEVFIQQSCLYLGVTHIRPLVTPCSAGPVSLSSTTCAHMQT